MNRLTSSLAAPVDYSGEYMAFTWTIIALALILMAVIAIIVITSIALARISHVKSKIDALPAGSVSRDEALTDEENAMLDSFRKLDVEKRKMLIDTAQAWHKSNERSGEIS